MECPSCHKPNPLSWSRYFRSATGKHTCEHCGATFALDHSPKYYGILIVLTLLLGVGPALIAFVLGVPKIFSFMIGLVLGFSILIPADKYMDEHLRKTRAI